MDAKENYTKDCGEDFLPRCIAFFLRFSKNSIGIRQGEFDLRTQHILVKSSLVLPASLAQLSIAKKNFRLEKFSPKILAENL